MTRLFASSTAAALAALTLAAAPAMAQERAHDNVAGAFMAAAQAQDRQTALGLLDEKVSIQFPIRAARTGHAQGQPFVIGYLDGLFERGVSVDGRGPLRFLMRDARTQELYAIDVEVRGEHVVAVTVTLDSQEAAGPSAASS